MEIMSFLQVVFCYVLIFVFANLCLGGKRLVLESDLETEVINLKNAMAQKDAEIASLRSQLGSTYTRWGRSDCPENGTVLVYSGYMAGTYLETTGAGANYLCLSRDPTWDHFSESVNNVIRVTGVQYEFWSHQTGQGHDLQDFFGQDLHDSEAPCAVCRIPRVTNVMIPGRKDCYPGWTMEYSGYLVGAYGAYNDATEYVCLDRRPESVLNSAHDDNDNMLYFVEAHCGKSLECPPYVHDRELACVVCSQ